MSLHTAGFGCVGLYHSLPSLTCLMAALPQVLNCFPVRPSAVFYFDTLLLNVGRNTG